jgi:hypothetical protein
VHAGVAAPEQAAPLLDGVDDAWALRAHRERDRSGRRDLLELPNSPTVRGLEDAAVGSRVQGRRASRGEHEGADQGVDQTGAGRRPIPSSVDALDDAVSGTVKRFRVLRIDGERAVGETGFGSDRLPRRAGVCAREHRSARSGRIERPAAAGQDTEPVGGPQRQRDDAPGRAAVGARIDARVGVVGCEDRPRRIGVDHERRERRSGAVDRDSVPAVAAVGGLVTGEQPGVDHAPVPAAVHALSDPAVGARVHCGRMRRVGRERGDVLPGLVAHIAPAAATVGALEDVAPTARVDDLRIGRIDRKREDIAALGAARRLPATRPGRRRERSGRAPAADLPRETPPLPPMSKENKAAAPSAVSTIAA